MLSFGNTDTRTTLKMPNYIQFHDIYTSVTTFRAFWKFCQYLGLGDRAVFLETISMSYTQINMY